MVVRVSLKERASNGGGNYFSQPKENLVFVPTGCKMLDLALGGGWAEGRIANIVGDKSSGKTLLCIEACSNFSRMYEKGKIKYRETEAAFDKSYAAALGMPIDRVDFGDGRLETVEDLFTDLDQTISKSKGPELYICDSLDALSDRAEMERDMGVGSYGAEKAKKMSQLFRRLTSKLEQSRITLIIVSQVRDKIGVTFGRKTTRTGGRALDFYASQVIYLAQVETITRTIGNFKRPTGILVKAKVDKNKISLPFREATFEISFGYGVNDVLSCLEWMKQGGFLKDLGVTDKTMKKYAEEMMRTKAVEPLHKAVQKRWYEVEESFLPKHMKYV